MLAGALARSTATAIRIRRRQTATGATRTEEEVLGEFRFFRMTKKEQAATLGKEDAERGTMMMLARMSPATDGMTHYRYRGALYKAKKYDRPAEHALEITGTLVNE